MACKVHVLGTNAVKSVNSTGSDAVAALIRKLRKDSHLTQMELCTKLGQDSAYVSKIERGIRRIDLIEFCDILLAMGLDPKQVFADFFDIRYGEAGTT